MNFIKKITSVCLLLAMCMVSFGYRAEAKLNNDQPNKKSENSN